MVDPAPGILRPPGCPEGVPADTPVPALVMGSCPDRGVGFIDPAITYFVTEVASTSLPDHFIGVVDLGDGPVRYAALFGFEKTWWFAFDEAGRLIGAGGGGSCATFDLQPRLAAARWLTGPDWSD